MPRLLRWAALRMHSAVFRGPESCGIHMKSSVIGNPIITYSVIMVWCGPSGQANCDPGVSSRH